jgi:hypothetical protein
VWHTKTTTFQIILLQCGQLRRMPAALHTSSADARWYEAVPPSHPQPASDSYLSTCKHHSKLNPTIAAGAGPCQPALHCLSPTAIKKLPINSTTACSTASAGACVELRLRDYCLVGRNYQMNVMHSASTATRSISSSSCLHNICTRAAAALTAWWDLRSRWSVRC